MLTELKLDVYMDPVERQGADMLVRWYIKVCFALCAKRDFSG